MDFAFEMMDFAFKMMDYVLKLMDYVLKLMNYVLKLMDYVLKLMNYVFSLRRAGLSQSYSFVFMCIDMLVAQLLLATSSYGGLIIGVPLAGLCNGGIWTVLPMICADLFGLKHLGANYKIACFGEAVLQIAKQIPIVCEFFD